MSKLDDRKSINKYSGCFVALSSFKDKTIIAHGKKPAKVYKESAKQGVKDYVVVFVPEKDTTYVF
jgi:hypothetical protein